MTGSSESSWGTPLVAYNGGINGFVAKLTSAGVLSWNTFLLASDLRCINIDSGNNLYVGGSSSVSWGTPINPFASGASYILVAKLTSAGALLWNTYIYVYRFYSIM